MPDLILIDGGLGQLHAAQSALDAHYCGSAWRYREARGNILRQAGREDDPIVLSGLRSCLIHNPRRGYRFRNFISSRAEAAGT
jgi:hypothetical protein